MIDTAKFIYLSRVLRPLNIKGRTQTLSCGFDSSVGGALHRQRKGRGFESRSKPELSGHISSSVMAAFASFILSLLATVGHLLPQRLVYSRSHFIEADHNTVTVVCSDIEICEQQSWHKRHRSRNLAVGFCVINVNFSLYFLVKQACKENKYKNPLFN